MYLILILLGLYSCKADVDLQNISDTIRLNPSLITPLGDANLTLGDIVSINQQEGDMFVIDGDEICYQSTDSASFQFRNIDLTKNSQELSRTYNPTAVTTTYPARTSLPTVSSLETLTLGINSNPAVERIDSVVVSSATLNTWINVSADIASLRPADIVLTLSFPNGKIRKLNGSSSTITYTPTAFGTYAQITLTNLVMDVSGGATGIPVQIKIDSKTNTSAVTVRPTSTISCKLKISSVNYSVVYGYFQPDIQIVKVFRRKLNISNYLTNGKLIFDNPQINITANSNIGTYIGFQVDTVKAFVLNKPTVAPVYAWFNNHTSLSFMEFFTTKPKKPGDWVNHSLKTFDKNYGETYQLFSGTTLPDMLEYRFSFVTNTTAISADPTPNFITPDGQVKVKINTKIPFSLKNGSFYELKDTVANVFDSIASQLDKYSTAQMEYTSLIFNHCCPLKAENYF